MSRLITTQLSPRTSKGYALKPGIYVLNPNRVRSFKGDGGGDTLRYLPNKYTPIVEYNASLSFLADNYWLTDIAYGGDRLDARLQMGAGVELTLPVWDSKKNFSTKTISADQILYGRPRKAESELAAIPHNQIYTDLYVDNGKGRPKKYLLAACVDEIPVVFSPDTVQDLTLFGAWFDGAPANIGVADIEVNLPFGSDVTKLKFDYYLYYGLGYFTLNDEPVYPGQEIDLSTPATLVLRNADGTVNTTYTVTSDQALAYLNWMGDEFLESPDNDGSIAMTLPVELFGDTLTVEDDTLTPTTHYTVANVPDGLTVNIDAIGDRLLAITLTGNATSHEETDSITNLTIAFTDALFTESDASEVYLSTRNNLKVTFADEVVAETLTAADVSQDTNGTFAIGDSFTLKTNQYIRWQNVASLDAWVLAAGGAGNTPAWGGASLAAINSIWIDGILYADEFFFSLFSDTDLAAGNTITVDSELAVNSKGYVAVDDLVWTLVDDE